VGSPILSTTAEEFLQYFEDKHVNHILDTSNIMLHICYVDDILILFVSQKIHPDLITADINQIHKDIKFNPTHEDSGQMNFITQLLILKPLRLKLTCSAKPTDKTIIFFSNDPTEHKIAAYRYYITKIHSLPLIFERKQNE
jgi:hypothetical protein